MMVLTICQDQRIMSLALKDISKEEPHKSLIYSFIYPVFHGEWVSPMVIVPKKGGKWYIRNKYCKLNKATRKNHLPLPFID